jgi:hypothetical protein
VIVVVRCKKGMEKGKTTLQAGYTIFFRVEHTHLGEGEKKVNNKIALRDEEMRGVERDETGEIIRKRQR